MSRTYFLVRKSYQRESGGVEKEYDALSILLRRQRKSVEILSKTEILECARPEDIVYVQEEGRLSPEYLEWARSLLLNGVIVFEKNVFALPSKFRPKHPNYRMILLSRDGAYRYALRGAFFQNQQDFALIVPNFINNRKNSFDLNSVSLELESRFRILRAGRDDPKKWSSYELEFCENLFSNQRKYSALLTLVGCPKQYQRESKNSNLSVSYLNYTLNLEELYRVHNYYLLYSKIGETFGNTLFEAAANNLRVIFIFNLSWDCGPIEYLENYYSNFRIIEISTTKLIDIDKLFEAQIDTSENRIHEINILTEMMLNENYASLEMQIPSLKSSVEYLSGLGRKYGVSWRRILIALTKEFVREQDWIKLVKLP